VLCREEAVDLCSIIEPKKGPLVIGVIKEQELSEDEIAANPKKARGTQEFAEIFSCADGGLFLDEERALYNQMGGRKITGKGQLFSLWNVCRPFAWWREIKEMGARAEEKKVKGNFNGEGLVQGGILIISPEGKVVYMYPEQTGSEIPLDEIRAAITSFGGVCKEPELRKEQKLQAS